MAIEKMKHLQLAAMEADRPALLAELQRFGCLEITEQAEALDYLEFARTGESDSERVRADADLIKGALAILDRYAPVRTPLFDAGEAVDEKTIFDDGALAHALKTAALLRTNDAAAAGLTSRIAHTQSQRDSLTPWLASGFPLERDGTAATAVRYGMLPASASPERAQEALSQLDAELETVSSDRSVHYCALLSHRSCLDDALDALKPFGFSIVSFRGLTGSPAEAQAALDAELTRLSDELADARARIVAFSAERTALRRASDRLALEAAKEASREKFLTTKQVFFLTGWVLARKVPELEALLAPYDCALELRDPQPDEAPKVPVQLRTTALTRPLTMVTEMYSLPAYDGIDPNPLILPFFTVFFGIMYADLGYGLVLLLLGILGNLKIKKQGTVKYMCGLLVLCGITTSIFGFLFGGFFGDSLDYRVFGWLRGALTSLPFFGVKDPLQDPMWFMYASLACGGVHLIFGQMVHMYMCFRDGQPVDAICDVVPWWLTFAGIALGALGRGWWLLLVGVLSLICTQGREKPTLIGKFFGGLKSLYDITSWLGDMLSYTRLMALMLAGSVIANVFNMLGNMTGQIIAILIIFIVGHVFNMAINIIGTYVHAARLQYLEFFGKFYKDGGIPFKPLRYQTKYTQIVKEET